jgi:hypothetical protein
MFAQGAKAPMPAELLELGGMERHGPYLWSGRPNPATMARARTTFAMGAVLAAAPVRGRGNGGAPGGTPFWGGPRSAGRPSLR